MKIFLLAIVTTVSLAASALSEELSVGEITWGNAAAECLERVAPACEVRTDHPQFPGKPKIWCPAKTPQFIDAQATCDKEADAASKPGPAGKWKHREVPTKRAGYDAS